MLKFEYIFGTICIIALMIHDTESGCQEGLSASVNIDVIPDGIRDADLNFHQACDSDVDCLRQCKQHSNQCNMAVWDRINSTCDLVCTPNDAQLQTKIGVTSFINMANMKQDYTIIGSRLIYPIKGGLTLDRVIHIYGQYITLNDWYYVMLFNNEKTELVFLYKVHHGENYALINSCRNVNPLNFPDEVGCSWQSETSAIFPTAQSGTKFEMQVFANSAQEFGVKIDDSYEEAFPNRNNIQLEDVTYLVIYDIAEHFNLEHLCIW